MPAAKMNLLLASILTSALVESYEVTDISPAIAQKGPESWIPALSIKPGTPKSTLDICK
jgi:hypothetical protein